MIHYPSIDKAISSLDNWFQKNHRPLPFREKPTPYTTWISEVMSQQTTIQTIIPYFQRFILAYPTIQDLANAPIEDVLTIWSGLGYYSRARNLHKTAIIVVQKHNGILPNTLTELKNLPGIGDYTAGAILSIALNQPVPIVDTNVRRVFSRLKAQDLHTKKLLKISEYFITYAYNRRLSQPSIINQAIMEIGALVCKSKEALCSKCPLYNICKVDIKQLNAIDFPFFPIKTPKIIISETAVLFSYKDRFGEWILVDTSEQKWTKGLWDLPRIQKENTKNEMTNLYIHYTVTNHKITRMIVHHHLIKKDFLPLDISQKPHEWINITLLNIKQPTFPMSSALKKSIMEYKKYNY